MQRNTFIIKCFKRYNTALIQLLYLAKRMKTWILIDILIETSTKRGMLDIKTIRY